MGGVVGAQNKAAAAEGQVGIDAVRDVEAGRDAMKCSSRSPRGSASGGHRWCPRAAAARCGQGRTKLGIGTAGDDLALLQAYYAALKARLERSVVMGRRKADKFDE